MFLRSFKFATLVYRYLFIVGRMSFNGLRVDYALEDNSNFIAWKDRMEAVLDDNGLLEYIKIDIPKPGSIDSKNLA